MMWENKLNVTVLQQYFSPLPCSKFPSCKYDLSSCSCPIWMKQFSHTENCIMNYMCVNEPSKAYLYFIQSRVLKHTPWRPSAVTPLWCWTAVDTVGPDSALHLSADPPASTKQCLIKLQYQILTKTGSTTSAFHTQAMQG